MAGIDPDQLEALQDALADFQTELENVIAEIEEGAWDDSLALHVAAPNVTRFGSSTPNPYYEGDYTLGGDGTPEGAEDYQFAAYRADVGELTSLLSTFVDEADPERFDTINQRLRDVYDMLERALEFDGGLNDVSIALGGWTGGAATNFCDVIIKPFGARLLRQASLAMEIAAAAMSYKAILLCARADVLDLAEQLRDKITLRSRDGSLSLGTALAVIGSVASGIGLVTATGPIAWPALVSWYAGAAGTANSLIEEVTDEEVAEEYALTGLERNSGGGESEERKIHGDEAARFIPSAREKINRVTELAQAEESKIRDGLRADLNKLDPVFSPEAARPRPADGPPLEFREPELTTADTLADLGVPPDLTIGDIVGLKKVGAKDLPAVAHILHQAYAKVDAVRVAFNSCIADSAFLGAYGWLFEEVVDLLDTALTRTRDFLYESGQNLVAIADGYYSTEEESRQALEDQLAQEGITLEEHIAASDYPGHVTPENISFDDLYMEDVEEFEHEIYVPNPPTVVATGVI